MAVGFGCDAVVALPAIMLMLTTLISTAIVFFKKKK